MRFSKAGKLISQLIATVFGTGHIPFAPGTAGTLVALVIYLLLPESIFISLSPGLIILFVLSFASVAITGSAEKQMSKDDKRIVLDEFVGFFFAVFFLPKKLVLIIIAFILFRMLDIFKPFPINLVQKFKGGWGIMADDLLAGVSTNICLQIIIKIFPEL